MRDSTVIRASPELVWCQIFQVPAIRSDELPRQWIHLLGFPRPVAAIIDKECAGGRRHATFERDVSFFEVVTHWEPNWWSKWVMSLSSHRLVGVGGRAPLLD